MAEKPICSIHTRTDRIYTCKLKPITIFHQASQSQSTIPLALPYSRLTRLTSMAPLQLPLLAHLLAALLHLDRTLHLKLHRRVSVVKSPTRQNRTTIQAAFMARKKMCVCR
ncbi:hypothetical protein AAFF_G00069390 [Aldrovandia affinis]|uniref:Uncharacterized protein n=1 Tax=Aldrovandia affinis TaxID=143900 RepID=A0AAD7RZI8_9TELE|nr:hypothetical protein AAFF_G00069390 [Aldrovandia affinis]